MADMQVTGSAVPAASWQVRQAQAAQAKEEAPSSPAVDLYEMMKDAKEKADAAREKYKNQGKGSGRYGDAPI